MRLKKEVILVILILFSLSAYSISYSIDLIVYKDRADIDRVRVTGATGFDQGGVGSHILSLYDGENNKLHEYRFTPNFVTTDHPPRELDRTFESFRFPFDPRAKVLVLTDAETILMTQNNIDTIVCNADGRCDGDENAISCLTDCRSGVNDGFCDGMSDDLCDPNCCDPVCSQSRDPDCRIDSRIALECGNGVCDDIETHLTCPDCEGKADGLCDGIGDGICDPDCSESDDLDCLTEVPPIEPPVKPPVKPPEELPVKPPVQPLEPEPQIKPLDTNSKVNGNLIIIILIAVLIIAGILIYLNKDNFIHKSIEPDNVKKPDSALEDYIHTNLNSGFTKDQIRNTLVKHGHADEKIDEMLKNL